MGIAPGGISVVLVNDEAALVIEQSIEDMGRFVCGRGDHLGVVRPKLIRQMSIELNARVLPLVQVHQSTNFATTADTKELTIRGRRGAGAQLSAKGWVCESEIDVIDQYRSE